MILVYGFLAFLIFLNIGEYLLQRDKDKEGEL